MDKLTQMVSVIGGIHHHMPDAFQPFGQAARFVGTLLWQKLLTKS